MFGVPLQHRSNRQSVEGTRQSGTLLQDSLERLRGRYRISLCNHTLSGAQLRFQIESSISCILFFRSKALSPFAGWFGVGCRRKFHGFEPLLLRNHINRSDQIRKIEVHSWLGALKFGKRFEQWPDQDVTIGFGKVYLIGKLCGWQPAHSKLHGTNEAFVKKRCEIAAVFIGKIGSAASVKQQPLFAYQLFAITNGQWVQQVMQECMAHQVKRRRRGIDDHNIAVSDVAHIRFVADHGLYIHPEGSHSWTDDFSKISGGGQDDSSEWLAETGRSALIGGLELAPELFNLCFFVKICEHLAKTIEGQHTWRQLVAFKGELEFRRRPGDQSKSYEAGESCPGVTQGMLVIVIAQCFSCRAVERTQVGSQLRQIRSPRSRIGSETHSDESAHGGKNLRVGFDVDGARRLALRGSRFERSRNRPQASRKRKQQGPDPAQSGRRHTIADLRGYIRPRAADFSVAEDP